MNINQEKVVCFLDKKQITKANVCEYYDAFLQSKPKVLITDENYRMQFRVLIKHESSFADYMIASIFKISRPNARQIRKTLHDELGVQNIADPSCDLRVLRPDYWQAVCAELDTVCPEHHLALWAKVKSDMATVFNDADALWLYFPKNRVLGALQIICNDLRATPAINIAKTEYLLAVLDRTSMDRTSIKLDSRSLETLSEQKQSIKTLYEKACMNGLLDLDFDAQPNAGWQYFCADVIKKKNIKAGQVLLADKQFDPKNNNLYMELAYTSGSFDMVRLLCPIQQSWSKLIEKLVSSTWMLDASKFSMSFMMLTATSLGAPLFFKEKRFFNASEDACLLIRDSVGALSEMVDKAKRSPSILQKYTLFSSVSPLSRELIDTIMINLVNAHSSLDMSDEEIKSLVPFQYHQ